MSLSVEAAEQAVLGAILTRPESLETAVELLVDADFHHARNRIIYHTMTVMAARGVHIDLVTLKETLSADGTLQAVGGVEYLVSLGMAVTGFSHVKYHSKMVAAASRLRKIDLAVTEIREESINVTVSHPESVDSFCEEAQQKLWKATQTRLASSQVHESADLGERAMLSLTGKDENHNRRVMTGFSGIDTHILGIRPSELLVIAGRPGSGKTLLGFQIGLNAALEGKRVLFVSFEMDAVSLTMRGLSNLSGVPHATIRDRKVTDDDITELAAAQRKFGSLAFKIAESLDPSPATLRSACRRAGKIDLVVIDYLQYMHDRTQENRWLEVSACSHATKAIAKEFDTAVISLSQLGRAAEGERPKLSHLRESGSIEQDADQVILLSQDANEPDYLVADVAKNRHGSGGPCKLLMRPTTFQVKNPDFFGSSVPISIYS